MSVPCSSRLMRRAAPAPSDDPSAAAAELEYPVVIVERAADGCQGPGDVGHRALAGGPKASAHDLRDPGRDSVDQLVRRKRGCRV